MYVLTSDIEELALPDDLAGRESLLTVGAFDGIHLGHQALIRELVAHATQAGRLSGLVTFYPHPASILRPEYPPLYLTTPGEKAVLLEPLQLDWLAVVSFTEGLAATSPRDFMSTLYERMNMRGVWVGPDFALGRDRLGNVLTLKRLGEEMGFRVVSTPYVTQNGEKVSSTQIRTLVRRGHVEEAARLLARMYSVAGEVVRGAQRGRCLGYPTANVAVHPERIIPANGIYATFAWIGSERYASVTSIGVRPTFDNGERSVETHILDFSDNLYGRDLVIEFVARLRPEKRFPDVKALVSQIDRDVVAARGILAASGN
jgi:riboflavin kinase/FMN adenylyltransferase